MIKNFEKKYSAFIKYLCFALVTGLIFYGLYFSIWTVLYPETGNGDNVEHLHATWLVAYGKVPYRDFFQHHNPLMWYIFAPLMYFPFALNIINLLNLAHAIGVFSGWLTFFVVYRICSKFLASRLASLLSLLVLCPPYFYVYCFNFNPDTFMALSFSIGIYFLFDYWEKPTLTKICISFMMFFVAFLFTQKILILLGLLGVISLYMFYYKKTPIEDILYALLLPFSGLLLFLALLYSANSLEIYWQSNYLFNIVMQKYYGNNQTSVAEYQALRASVILALIGAPFFFKSRNYIYKVLAILFALELLQRCFYFSIAPYYLLPLMIFVCCLNSVLFDFIIKKCFILVYIFLGLAIYYAGISKAHYLSVRSYDRSFAKYLTQNITPCDYLISGYFGNQSIYSKDPYYYWSMLGHIDMAGEEMGIYPHPDLNSLVLQYKPKLINGGIYWSSYDQNRGRKVAIQQISPEIIDKFYLPTPFADFYVLKYEYRKKNCSYNRMTKEWMYAD